ncbi:type I secretion C-terminal target domain-containing protein [Oceanimonas baumannii]|uniref:type I secretion C-terminal target domain-containing protein n=1 Tax=Oceanimonas baumannii TaxID=129578 RepID=UPI003A95D598
MKRACRRAPVPAMTVKKSSIAAPQPAVWLECGRGTKWHRWFCGSWSVNTDGTFSYTLTQATTDVDGVAETDSFSYTATDGFGNTVTNTVVITIVDDEPNVSAQNLTIANVEGVYTVDYQLQTGADESGGITLSGVSPDGLTYNVVSQTDGSQQLTATLDGSDDIYFILTVYESGHYEFELVNPEPVVAFTKELVDLTPGGPQPSVVLPINGITATFSELLPTPDEGGVNSSSPGMGVDNNHINDDNLMKVSFSEPVYNVSFKVNNLRSGDILLWTVLGASGDVIAEGTWTPPSGTNQNEKVSFNILDPIDGSVLTYTSGSADDIKDEGIYALELGAGEGDKYRLLDITVYEQVLPEDNEFIFNLDAEDGDGDTVSTSFTVFVEGGGTVEDGFTLTGTDSDEVLWGSSGNDTLLGGAGNDILNGGLGDNILTGGEGIDTFQFTDVDINSVNKITDFNIGEQDVVDISELLSGADNTNLNSYLEFSLDGSDTVLTVTPSGAGSDTQEIRFEGVDLLNGMSSADLIQSMVDDNTLQVDKT